MRQPRGAGLLVRQSFMQAVSGFMYGYTEGEACDIPVTALMVPGDRLKFLEAAIREWPMEIAWSQTKLSGSGDMEPRDMQVHRKNRLYHLPMDKYLQKARKIVLTAYCYDPMKQPLYGACSNGNLSRHGA